MNSSSGKTEETPAQAAQSGNDTYTTKTTVAADGSGDVFPRELPEGYAQSSSLMLVRTVGFGPRPRGATVGVGPSDRLPEVDPPSETLPNPFAGL